MIEIDVMIVGGGIAGASAAFEIAGFARVALLERESRCGVHSTGRSAASFTENYGNAVIRRLAIASRAFVEVPPQTFADRPLLSPRGMITVARADQTEALAQALDVSRSLVPSIRAMTADEALRRVPALRPDYVAAAMFEPESRDIDVDGLHQGFLRGARTRGTTIVTGADVLAIERVGERWRVETQAGAFAAPILINAAGAWADQVARSAGLEPLGLVPKRRTAFTVAVPEHFDIGGWPLVDDVGEAFYFKPDAGRLFVSPADATPSEPCDAYPDDLDVAIGVERLERATTLTVRQAPRAWAGLRTFATDGSPVVGEDPRASGFFWLAGQGGYGVKTSPALSRLSASLIRHGRFPDDLTRLGLTAAELGPQRLLGRPVS